jgi:valyl-tRNA synthetase
MVMMGCEFMGEIPFRQVYIHGLVRDAERQKMSKTRGNTIDPLVVTEKYGTDAVRMALLLGAAPGTDIVLSEDRMESTRAFANKIWNAARLLFVNMERSGVEPWLPNRLETFRPEAGPSIEVAVEDRWIFSRLNTCAEQVNRAIEQYRYHEAAQLLWHFFWHEFCDWYLELKKPCFQETSGVNADWRNVLSAFETALRLLHPAMPFLTEELWQRLANGRPTRPVSIALAEYPQYLPQNTDFAAEREIGVLQEVVTLARTLRTEMKLDPKLQLQGTLHARGDALEIARRHAAAIRRLSGVSLEFSPDPPPAGATSRSTSQLDLVLHVPKTQMEAQRRRLEKENDQLTKNIASLEKQLSDDSFLSRAPEPVVANMRTKLSDYQAQLAKNKAALESLE